jgi:hypothetical protein
MAAVTPHTNTHTHTLLRLPVLVVGSLNENPGSTNSPKYSRANIRVIDPQKLSVSEIVSASIISVNLLSETLYFRTVKDVANSPSPTEASRSEERNKERRK